MYNKLNNRALIKYFLGGKQPTCNLWIIYTGSQEIAEQRVSFDFVMIQRGLLSGPLGGALINVFGCRQVGCLGGLLAGLAMALTPLARNIYYTCLMFGILGGRHQFQHSVKICFIFKMGGGGGGGAFHYHCFIFDYTIDAAPIYWNEPLDAKNLGCFTEWSLHWKPTLSFMLPFVLI